VPWSALRRAHSRLRRLEEGAVARPADALILGSVAAAATLPPTKIAAPWLHLIRPVQAEPLL
jgi:hypothetical protein